MDKKCLDLFIELAPKLNEYRGELFIEGDGWVCQKGQEGIWGTSFPEFCERCIIQTDKCILTWVPKAIDPQDPARIARGENPRGLISMIKGFHSLSPCYKTKTEIAHWIVTVWEDADSQRSVAGDTPAEALLLALESQWRKNE